MLSINWFHLIFIIIITLATIQAAPIDMIEPPVITLSPNDMQIPVSAVESLIKEIPNKHGDDNHVESQTLKDLVTSVADTNTDQIMLNFVPSFNEKYQEFQQNVTTETGTHLATERTHQSTTFATHMEVTAKKTKEFANSENQNLSTTTEGNEISTEKSTTQTNFDVTENPVIQLESDVIDPQLTIVNLQYSTKANLIQNQNLPKDFTQRVNVYGNNENVLNAFESENINFQNENENIHNTTEKNLQENQSIRKEKTTQLGFSINENPRSSSEREIVNAQTTNKIVQNTTGNISQENLNSSEEPTLQVMPNDTLDSETNNSQIKYKNAQNAIEGDNSENQTTPDITKKPVPTIKSEINNSEIIKTHNQIVTKEITTQENFNIIETTHNAIGLGIFNSVREKEHLQKSNDEVSTEIKLQTTEDSLSPLESTLFYSERQQQNIFRNTAKENTTETAKYNKEISTQVNLNTTEDSLIPLGSDFITEKYQNSANENTTENQKAIEEPTIHTQFSATEDFLIPLETEIINSQNINENLKNAHGMELQKNNAKQTISPHESNQSDNKSNFFTQNINLQKLTDQIEESVKNIVKQSEENVGKSENNRSHNSHFLNENVQYSELVEKSETGSDNKANVTIKVMQGQQYKPRNESVNSFTYSESTQTPSVNFSVEQTVVKSDMNQDTNFTDQDISESTKFLTTTENLTDLSDKIEPVKNLDNVEISESSIIPGISNENVQNSWDITSVEESTKSESTKSPNSTEYLNIVEISSSPEKIIEHINNASNIYQQTVKDVLNGHKLNSQITKETPQFNILSKNNAVEEQITPDSSLHEIENHLTKLDVDLLDSQIYSPNAQNVPLNLFAETYRPIAQNVENLTGDNINTQISPKLLSENAHNPITDHKLKNLDTNLQISTQLNDHVKTQSLPENTQKPHIDSVLERIGVEPTDNAVGSNINRVTDTSTLNYELSPVNPNVAYNLSNHLANQSSTAQESSTIAPAEETTENILNTSSSQNIDSNSDASQETPGILILKENIDVATANFHTTNINNNKMPASSNENISNEEYDSSPLKWNTEKSSKELIFSSVPASQTVQTSSVETENTITDEIPVTPKIVEVTTVSEKIPSFTEKTVEFNLQKAFESLQESTENNENVEATTLFTKPEDLTSAPATESIDTFPTTESTAEEEPTVTTYHERSTTNSQFATLLEETEMNVHRAFETLREWIANGRKLEESTKNPAQLAELTTTINPEFETTKMPETIFYTRIKDSGETSNTKDESEFGSIPNTSTTQDNNESTTISTMNIEEVEILKPTVENLNYNVEKFARLQVKDETTDLMEENTPNSGTANLTFVSESFIKDVEAETIEPSFIHAMENKTEVNQTDKSEIEEAINHNRNIMNVKFFNKDNTILYQPTPATFHEEMVKFIERETTDSSKHELQTTAPLSQASFMVEQQQQIESTTTDSDIRSENTTLGAQNDITTMGETNVNTINITTEEIISMGLLQTKNKASSSSTELHSTMTELPATTEVRTTAEFPETTDSPKRAKYHTTIELTKAEEIDKTTEFTTTQDNPVTTEFLTTTKLSPTPEYLTTTELPTSTEEDTTITTDEPEIATTTLIVPAEPEGRSLALPPPKLEYLQNEDGVEVFYGYSIVKHN